MGNLEHKKYIDTSRSQVEEEFDMVEKEGIRGELENIKDELKLKKMGVEYDHGVYFYTIKEGDTLTKIWSNLKKVKALNYMYQDENYYHPLKGNKSLTWNIEDKQLLPGVELPIPQNKEKRLIKNIDYGKVITDVLHTLKGHEEYNMLTQELSGFTSEYLAKVIQVFLEKESNAGLTSLYRRESGHKKFSYSWYHFLFPSNSKQKQGPFSIAANKLGYTKGQIMTDFTMATTVFFAGLHEKTKKYVERSKQGVTMQKRKAGEEVFDFNKVYQGGYAGLFAQDNLKNLAWLYNGIDRKGRGLNYANDFISKFLETQEEAKEVKKVKKEKVKESITKASKQKETLGQTPGTFKEIQPFAGMRMRRYVVKSGGTVNRVNQLFKQRKIATGITTKVVGVELDDVGSVIDVYESKYDDLSYDFSADEYVYITEYEKQKTSLVVEKKESLEYISEEERISKVIKKNIKRLNNIFSWNQQQITTPEGYFIPPEELRLSKRKYNYFFERTTGNMGKTLIMNTLDKNNNVLHEALFSQSSGSNSFSIKIDGYELFIKNNAVYKGNIKDFAKYEEKFEAWYKTLLEGK